MNRCRSCPRARFSSREEEAAARLPTVDLDVQVRKDNMEWKAVHAGKYYLDLDRCIY